MTQNGSPGCSIGGSTCAHTLPAIMVAVMPHANAHAITTILPIARFVICTLLLRIEKSIMRSSGQESQQGQKHQMPNEFDGGVSRCSPCGQSAGRDVICSHR